VALSGLGEGARQREGGQTGSHSGSRWVTACLSGWVSVSYTKEATGGGKRQEGLAEGAGDLLSSGGMQPCSSGRMSASSGFIMGPSVELSQHVQPASAACEA
jgi:hypothetical protein